MPLNYNISVDSIPGKRNGSAGIARDIRQFIASGKDVAEYIPTEGYKDFSSLVASVAVTAKRLGIFSISRKKHIYLVKSRDIL